MVADKGPVYRWNVFLRRQLTKRLATMCWDLGRPPLWLQNMHADFSWCQVAWHIENDFYPAGIGQDLLGMLTIDEFRAMTAIKGGIIPQLHSIVPAGTASPFDAERIVRAALGLCLLHDIGERGFPTWHPFFNRQRARMLQAMEEQVHFFSGSPFSNDDPLFIPYWRQQVVKCTTPGVYASVYWNRQMRKAAVVLLNTNDEDVVVQGFNLDGRPIGMADVGLVTDAETGMPLPKAYDEAKRLYVWGELNPYQVMLRRHDFRILALE
jgi:hypothetical protein